MSDLVLLVIFFYLANWASRVISYLMSSFDDEHGPLTKILINKITSKDVFAKKLVLILFPVFLTWSILYGLYKFIKWFMKLLPI